MDIIQKRKLRVRWGRGDYILIPGSMYVFMSILSFVNAFVTFPKLSV